MRCGIKCISWLINYSQEVTHVLATKMSTGNGAFYVSDYGVVNEETGSAQWVSGTHHDR